IDDKGRELMFCCLFHVDFLRLNHIIQSSLSRCFSFSDTLTGIHAVSREREKQGQCLCIACPEINSPIVARFIQVSLLTFVGNEGRLPVTTLRSSGRTPRSYSPR